MDESIRRLIEKTLQEILKDPLKVKIYRHIVHNGTSLKIAFFKESGGKKELLFGIASGNEELLKIAKDLEIIRDTLLFDWDVYMSIKILNGVEDMVILTGEGSLLPLRELRAYLKYTLGNYDDWLLFMNYDYQGFKRKIREVASKIIQERLPQYFEILKILNKK